MKALRLLRFIIGVLPVLLLTLQSSLADEWDSPLSLPDPDLEAHKLCKMRCERSRGGGFHGFMINCDMRFVTEAEKLDCRHDCQVECPPQLCLDGNVIICPGIPEELELEQKRSQEKFGQWQLQLNMQKEEKMKRKEEAEAKIKEEKEKQTWLLVGLSLGLIFFIVCVVAVLWYLSRKDSRKKSIQQIRKLSQQQEQYLTIGQPRGSGGQGDFGQQDFAYGAPPLQYHKQAEFPTVSRAQMEPPLEKH